MKQLTLSQSIEGFLLEKQAQHLSPHTVADYTNVFRKLQAYLGTDVPFAGITADQIRGFLGDLSTPRAPAGAAKRPAKGLSNKTILNIHTALAAGIEERLVEGVPVRVYDPAKTVVDCFKYRNKIGLEVALEALRMGWRERRFTMDQLWGYATICRMTNVMRPYVESLA